MQRRLSFLLAAMLLASGLADACSLMRKPPGEPEPFTAPFAVFEARVVEVHDADIQVHPQIRPEMTAKGQEGVIEVTRSFHGPYKTGDRLPTSTFTGGGSCGQRVDVGDRVWIWESVGPPFSILSTLAESEQPQDAFGQLARVPGPERHARLAGLGDTGIRGDLSDRAAAELLARAKPALANCHVARAKKYAEVRCGEAFDGNDAAFKVIFERYKSRWFEVMRWSAPSPADASATPTS